MLITILDAIGAIFSFSATICYIRVSILAWPLSLLSIAIDLYLYSTKGIYGDVALHLVYLGLTIYGWHQWKYGSKQHDALPITSITYSLAKRLGSIAVVGISIGYFILHNYTNSKVPLIDASTTVLSLIAQWLICRKIIQTWILWFVVDAMYAGLYLYKGIPIHGLLQILYVFMAIAGYLRWRCQLERIKESI